MAERRLVRGRDEFDLRLFVEHRRLAMVLLRELYRDVRGVQTSNLARQARLEESADRDDRHLTYGEVVPQAFQQLLLSCAPLIGSAPAGSRVFYDLGCGTGKAVMTAALGPHGFRSCRGIELIEDLAAIAGTVLLRLDAAVESLKEGGESEDKGQLLEPSPQQVKTSRVQDPSSSLPSVLSVAHRLLSESALLESDLANRLCLRVGAKAFRAGIKPFKSFRNLLAAHPTHFKTETVDGQQLVYSVAPPAEKSDEPPPPLPPKPIASRMERQQLLHELLSSSPASEEIRTALLGIEFLTGDIFDSVLCPWYVDADCVYVASLLFSDEMMRRLQTYAEQMRPGSVLVSLRPLEVGGRLSLVSESFYQMSWQKSKVYVYTVG